MRIVNAISYMFKLNVALIIACLYVHNAYAEEKRRIIEVFTADHPPLIGSKDTIMSDIVTEAFQVQKTKVVMVSYPTSRIQWAMETKTANIVLGPIDWFINSNINEDLITIDIYFVTMRLFGLREKFPNGIKFNDLSDIQNYRIGYVLGGVLVPLLREAGLKPNLFTSLQQTAKLTALGRIDVFIAPTIVGWKVINETYQEKKQMFVQSEKGLKTVSGNLIFHRDQQHLAEIFKKGLIKIIDNGTYLKIMKKYHGDNVLPLPVRKLIESNSTEKNQTVN
ncbi:transporter substrate-binding domain-containing protein [Vibrio sp. S4M6]|uniref:substrate-binding periplasmic protein n=1 Tax=Vibrio sinus TaxID=2946865 RepID=UPI00202A78A7|nr:transporter substrate-binding domain-containing protein [Vibrio sinus]MCL9782751.1 transporter substrate-binding domain-containing protein [Vibrio sinus]